jgi:hypothetical protein
MKVKMNSSIKQNQKGTKKVSQYKPDTSIGSSSLHRAVISKHTEPLSSICQVQELCYRITKNKGYRQLTIDFKAS